MRLQSHRPKVINLFVVSVSCCALVFLASASRAAAAPIVFSLSQPGFAGDGEVSGFFAGEDLNGDGLIAIFEVSDYRITFTGAANIPSFTHNLDDLQFFTYTLGSGGFLPSFPLFSDDGRFWYDADDHRIGLSPLTNESLASSIFTLQDATVHPVPEPPGITVLIFGLVICTALHRLRPGRKKEELSLAFEPDQP